MLKDFEKYKKMKAKMLSKKDGEKPEGCPYKEEMEEAEVEDEAREIQTDSLAREEMRDPQGAEPDGMPGAEFMTEEMRKMMPQDLLNYLMKSKMAHGAEAEEGKQDSGTAITIVLMGG